MPVSAALRLLLLSNSRNPGGEYLAHALPAIAELLGAAPRRLAFVPYAAVTFSFDEYVSRVRRALEPLGHELRSLHQGDPHEILTAATGILVGGGNSFRLLERVARLGLLDSIRALARRGVPYLGWSAGANLACPTIRTTNDMPIIEPPGFAALGLVPFQINPHYTDQVIPDHGGESRDDRIAEFLVLNPATRVIGLREGSILRLIDARIDLLGPHAMKLFQAGLAAREVLPGELDPHLVA